MARYLIERKDEAKEAEPGGRFVIGRKDDGGGYSARKSGMDAFLSGASDSVTFGWGDEIQGGLAGLGAMFTGGDYWDAYNQSVDEARRWQDEARMDEGGYFLAGELGGALLGGFGGGAAAKLGSKALFGSAGAASRAAAQAAKAQSKGLLSRMGASVPVAAAGGGLYGAGASDGGENGDMATNALFGAAVGGVAAPLFMGVGAGLGKAVIDPLKNLAPDKAVIKYIVNEAKRYNLTPQQFMDNLDEIVKIDPKHGWLMDAVNPMGPDLVKAASAAAGPELAAAEAAAKTRNVALGEGARDSFWQNLFGKKERINYVTRVSEIDDALKGFDSVYKDIDARQLDPSTFPQELKDFVAKNAPDSYKVQTATGIKDVVEKPVGPFTDAMNAAMEVMRGELGTDVPAQVLMGMPKFWRTFLTAARHSTDDAWNGNNKALGMVRSQRYDALRSQLGKVLGKDWVEAQDLYRALKSERDGLEFGFDAVMKTDAPSLANNLKVFNAMSDEQKEWARKGMVLRLEEGIRGQETRSATRDMLRKVADNDLQRETLNRFFGRVKADGTPDLRFTKIASVMDDLDKRYTLFDNMQRSGLTSGPKTASVLTRAANQEAKTLPVAGEVLKGNLWGAIRKMLGGADVTAFNENVSNEIMRFMRKPAGELREEIRKAGGVDAWIKGNSIFQRALAERQKRIDYRPQAWRDAVGSKSLYSGVGGGTFAPGGDQ